MKINLCSKKILLSIIISFLIILITSEVFCHNNKKSSQSHSSSKAKKDKTHTHSHSRGHSHSHSHGHSHGHVHSDRKFKFYAKINLFFIYLLMIL